MKKPETKGVQVRIAIHDRLRKHCANTAQFMGAFVTAAIAEKIKRDKAK
jgi:hypothetical protein